MYDTAETQDTPCIKQLSVFLPNRLGALMLVTRVLEEQDVRVCAMSVMDAADHAVLRLVLDKPTLASATLLAEGYHLFEADLLAVRVPDTKVGRLRRLLSALLLAELNVNYVYPVVPPSHDSRPLLALHVEDLDTAARTLVEQGLELVGQDDLT